MLNRRQSMEANFLANPAGSTVTQTANNGVAVITIATENIAGGAGGTGAITAFVSQNTLTGDAQSIWLAGGLVADKLYGGACKSDARPTTRCLRVVRSHALRRLKGRLHQKHVCTPQL